MKSAIMIKEVRTGQDEPLFCSVNEKWKGEKMSDREKAVQLLDIVPDYKIGYVVAYLQGLTEDEEVPNEETIEAMKEAENMIKNDTLQHFGGSTSDFLKMALED